MTRNHTKMLQRISFILLILLSMLVYPFHTISAAHTSSQRSPDTHFSNLVNLPPHFLPLTSFQLRGINGPYRTSGNLILGADNSPYLFHGITRDNLEYFCKSDGHYTQQDLAYLGLGDTSARATYWGANTVRLPLSENFWLYGSPSQNCSPDQYQALVKQVVDILTGLNLNVIINLQWTNAGGQSTGAGDAWAMPDVDSKIFWHQVAGTYKNFNNVLFELFNEPHPTNHNWACWRNGCRVINDSTGQTGHDHSRFTYRAVGMQAMLETVRKTGSNNLVIVAGMGWGYDLSQIPAYHLIGSNIIYDTHPYPYSGKLSTDWDHAFGNISATYPVVSAESGQYDCGTTYISQLVNYFDTHNISWIGFAWVVSYGNVCHYPQLISGYTGKPVAAMGAWEYQHLKSYLTLLAHEEIPVRKK